MRKIQVANPTRSKVFAHVMDDNRTIDIQRGNNKFTITGTDFSIIGTDPFSPGRTSIARTSIIVKDGKLVEDDIRFKEEGDNSNGEEEPNTQPDNGNTAGSPPDSSSSTPASPESTDPITEPNGDPASDGGSVSPAPTPEGAGDRKFTKRTDQAVKA